MVIKKVGHLVSNVNYHLYDYSYENTAGNKNKNNCNRSNPTCFLTIQSVVTTLLESSSHPLQFLRTLSQGQLRESRSMATFFAVCTYFLTKETDYYSKPV